MRVRGDAQDVLSHGFLCPKGVALAELHADPDRLRTPLVRGDEGVLREASWDEAFVRIEAGLAPLLAAGDRQALAAYVGNPNAHDLANMLYLPVFLRALGRRNVFSASTLDQFPKQMAACWRSRRSWAARGSLRTLVVADVPRLRAARDRPADRGLVLVGRRDLRSNNSWMGNLPLLVSGPVRCTLQVHPEDDASRGLTDGETAVVRSRTGWVEAPVEVMRDVMPGVVSLPHGWGHDGDGLALGVAAAHAGVNANVLSDHAVVDVPSGNAVLNGIPVDVAPVATRAAAAVA